MGSNGVLVSDPFSRMAAWHTVCMHSCSVLIVTKMPEAWLEDFHHGGWVLQGVLSAGVAQGQGYGSQGGGPQPQSLPAIGARPRVRARRGQATDPHSIAERVRTVCGHGR